MTHYMCWDMFASISSGSPLLNSIYSLRACKNTPATLKTHKLRGGQTTSLRWPALHYGFFQCVHG